MTIVDIESAIITTIAKVTISDVRIVIIVIVIIAIVRLIIVRIIVMRIVVIVTKMVSVTAIVAEVNVIIVMPMKVTTKSANSRNTTGTPPLRERHTENSLGNLLVTKDTEIPAELHPAGCAIIRTIFWRSSSVTCMDDGRWSLYVVLEFVIYLRSVWRGTGRADSNRHFD